MLLTWPAPPRRCCTEASSSRKASWRLIGLRACRLRAWAAVMLGDRRTALDALHARQHVGELGTGGHKRCIGMAGVTTRQMAQGAI